LRFYRLFPYTFSLSKGLLYLLLMWSWSWCPSHFVPVQNVGSVALHGWSLGTMHYPTFVGHGGLLSFPGLHYSYTQNVLGFYT